MASTLENENTQNAESMESIPQGFRYKYPPDSNNYKYYLAGLASVILVLILTIIGVLSSPGHRYKSQFSEDDTIDFGGTYRPVFSFFKNEIMSKEFLFISEFILSFVFKTFGF